MKKPSRTLRPGLKKSIRRPVEFRWTIAAFDRRLPPVLATPAMIGMMETAAALLLKPYLPQGSISVGTHINVSHRAPATVGATVRYTAELTHTRRRRFRFAVAAYAGTKLLGEGYIERAIVHLPDFRQRFQAKRK